MKTGRNLFHIGLLSAALLPAAVQAQFQFTTNNDGSLNIYQYTGSDGAVVIPDTTNGLLVTSIGTDAFFFCTNLTSITIPDSVTNIGFLAFDGCTSLTAIEVDAHNPVYGSVGGVLFNRSTNTLIQCPEGRTGNYTVPDSVTNIGDYAFFGCAGLTGVIIGNSVASIGVSAFSYCSSLSNVAIPNSVISLGDWVFSNCDSLTNVTIPNGVISIGGYAFIFCGSLTSITIGNNVTDIGDYAFYGCGSLTGVYFDGNAPGADSTVFSGDTNATAYYLPGTAGWADFTLNTGLPAALWYLPNPTILNFEPNFGVQTNAFGFIISWATNIPVVVESCTNLTNPGWSPVATNALIGGWCYFSDPQWTNYPGRFYRLRSP